MRTPSCSRPHLGRRLPISPTNLGERLFVPVLLSWLRVGPRLVVIAPEEVTTRLASRGLITPRDKIAGSTVTVAIAGSGPAGTVVAWQMLKRDPTLDVVILERGPFQAARHVSEDEALLGASAADIDEARRSWIEVYGEHRSVGDLGAALVSIEGLGGKDTINGNHFARETSLKGWPLKAAELAPSYSEAESLFRVVTGVFSSPAGQRAVELLAPLSPSATPRSAPVVGGNTIEINRKTMSAAAILLSLARRHPTLRIVPNAYLTGLHQVGGLTEIEVRSGTDPSDPAITVRAEKVVLAASPVESNRLALASFPGADLPLGLGLSDHIYVRGSLELRRPLGPGTVDLVVPPQSGGTLDQFVVEIRDDPVWQGGQRLRLTSIISMDADDRNTITLARDARGTMNDDWGVPMACTRLSPSERDHCRVERATRVMTRIADRLGGNWIDQPQLFPLGRSHHECGGLALGRCTDKLGRLRLGGPTVYVAGAALFPSVGTANPLLPIAALGLRAGRAILGARNAADRAA